MDLHFSRLDRNTGPHALDAAAEEGLPVAGFYQDSYLSYFFLPGLATLTSA